jgi:hypothetical protein
VVKGLTVRARVDQFFDNPGNLLPKVPFRSNLGPAMIENKFVFHGPTSSRLSDFRQAGQVQVSKGLFNIPVPENHVPVQKRKQPVLLNRSEPAFERIIFCRSHASRQN